MQHLLLLTLITLLSSPVQAASNTTQRIINKGITDLNEINIKKKTKKLVIKKNDIDSIQNFTIPDNIRVFFCDKNNTQSINGLTFNDKLKRILIYDTLSSIKNLQLNDEIDEIDFSFNQLVDLSSLNFSGSNLRRFSVINNKIETLNGLVLNANTEELLFTTNLITNVDDYIFPTSLKILSLSRNNLVSLNGLNLTANLETLFIADNPFQDYTQITNLPENLQTLSIGGLSISANFSNLVIPDSVKEFIIGISTYTEDDIKTINFPPELRILDLSVNSITSLDGLEFPSSLRKLDLRNNPITKQEKRIIQRRFKKEIPKLKIKFGSL